MAYLKALFEIQIAKVCTDFPISLGKNLLLQGKKKKKKNSPPFSLWENLETSGNIYKTPHVLLRCGAQI